ncbi:hypothetical protein AB0E55_41220, partial [Amycolatopsis keratiniphila]|uniref:hypothetical protein n=1 Tax=Amycolatopsis keratiniphila TaxID=129921 RepID=UPI0033DBE1D1
MPVWIESPAPEHADAVRLNNAVKDLVAGYLANGLPEHDAGRLAQELATKLGTARTSPATPTALPGGAETGEPGAADRDEPANQPGPSSAVASMSDVVRWRPDPDERIGPRTLQAYLDTLVLPKGIYFDRSATSSLNSASMTWLRGWVQGLAAEKAGEGRWRYTKNDIFALGGGELPAEATVYRWIGAAREAASDTGAKGAAGEGPAPGESASVVVASMDDAVWWRPDPDERIGPQTLQAYLDTLVLPEGISFDRFAVSQRNAASMAWLREWVQGIALEKESAGQWRYQYKEILALAGAGIFSKKTLNGWIEAARRAAVAAGARSVVRSGVAPGEHPSAVVANKDDVVRWRPVRADATGPRTLQAYLEKLVLPEGISFDKAATRLNIVSMTWLREWAQSLAVETDSAGKWRYQDKDILALGGVELIPAEALGAWIRDARRAVASAGAEGEAASVVIASKEGVAGWRPGPADAGGPQTLRAYLDTLVLPRRISFDTSVSPLNSDSAAWLRGWVQSMAVETDSAGRWRYTNKKIMALAGGGFVSPKTVERLIRTAREAELKADAERVEAGGSGLAAAESAPALVVKMEDVARWRPDPVDKAGPQTLRAYLDTVNLPKGVSFDRDGPSLNKAGGPWLQAWVQSLAAEKDGEGRWRYTTGSILALGGEGLLKKRTVQTWTKAARDRVESAESREESGGPGYPVEVISDPDFLHGVAHGSGLPTEVVREAEEARRQWRQDSRVAASELDDLDELPHLPAQASPVGQSTSSYGEWTFAMEDFDFEEMMKTLPEWLPLTQSILERQSSFDHTFTGLYENFDDSGPVDTDPAGVMSWPSIPSDPVGARVWVDNGGGLSRWFGKSSAQEVRPFVELATRIVSRFHRVPVWTHSPGAEHADAVRLNDAVKDIVAGYLANGLSEQDAERLAEELATKLGTSRTSATLPVTLPGGTRPEAPPGVGEPSGSGPVIARGTGSAVATRDDVVRWRPGPDDEFGPETLRAYLDTVTLPKSVFFDKTATRLNDAAQDWLRAWVQGLAAEKDSEGRWRHTTKSILALGDERLLVRNTVKRWIREAREAVVGAAAGESHLASAVVATMDDVVRWRPGPDDEFGPETLRAYLDTVTLPKGVFFDRLATRLNDAARDWLRAWVQGLAVERNSEGGWRYAAGEILALGGEGLLSRRAVRNWINAARQPVAPAQPADEPGGLGSLGEAPSDHDVVGDAAHGSDVPAAVRQEAEDARARGRVASRGNVNDSEDLPHLWAQASRWDEATEYRAPQVTEIGDEFSPRWAGVTADPYGAGAFTTGEFDFGDRQETHPELLPLTQSVLGRQSWFDHTFTGLYENFDDSGPADTTPAGAAQLWPSIPSDPEGARAWVASGGGLSQRFGEGSAQAVRPFVEQATQIVSRFPWVPVWGENPVSAYADAARLHDAVKDVIATYLANGLSEQDAERLAEELATKLGNSSAVLSSGAETGAVLSELPRGSESESFPAVAQMKDVVRWRPDPANTAGPRTLQAYLHTLVFPEGVYFDKAAGSQLNNRSMAWLRGWVQGLAAEKDGEGRWRYTTQEIRALGGEGLFAPQTVRVWIREAREAAVDAGMGRAGVGGEHLASGAVAKKEDVARWRPDPLDTSGPRTLRAYLDTLTLPKGVFFDRTTTKLNDAARAWLLEWVQSMAAEKDGEGRWLYTTQDILTLGGEGLLKRKTVQTWMKAVRKPVAPVQSSEESGGLGAPVDDASDRAVVGDVTRGSGDRGSQVPEIGDERSSGWAGDSGDPYGAGAFDMRDFDFDNMLDTLPEWLSSTQSASFAPADIVPAGTAQLWPSIPSDPVGARAWVNSGGGLSRHFGESSAQEVRPFVERASRIVSQFPWVPVWSENPVSAYADASRLHDAVKEIIAGYLANGLSEQDAERLAEELATKLGNFPADLLRGAETRPDLADESRPAGFGELPLGSESESFSAVAKKEDVARWRPDPLDASGPRTFRAYLDTLVLPMGVSFDRAAVAQLNYSSMAWLRTWVQDMAVEKDSEGRWRHSAREILALGGEGIFVPNTVRVWIREAREALVDAEAERAEAGGAAPAPAAAVKKEDVARWRPDPVNAAGPKTLRAYLGRVILPRDVFFDRVDTKLNDVARDWLLAWVQGLAVEKDSEGRWLYSTGDIVALGGGGLLKRRTTQRWITAARKPVAPARSPDESSGLGSPAPDEVMRRSESPSAVVASVAKMEDVVRWRPDPLDASGPRTFRAYLDTLVLPMGVSFDRAVVAHLNNHSIAWLRAWVKGLAEEKDSDGQWRYDSNEILALGGEGVFIAATVRKWIREARKAAVDAEVGGIEVGGARLAPSGSAPVAVA